MGIIKLASPKKGDLNSFALAKLQDLLPLFSLALKQNSDEIQNKVQAIIKETYTSIHPSVEWKFLKAADQMLVEFEETGKYEQQPIVFNQRFGIDAITITCCSVIVDDVIGYEEHGFGKGIATGVDTGVAVSINFIPIKNMPSPPTTFSAISRKLTSMIQPRILWCRIERRTYQKRGTMLIFNC